MNCVSPTYIRNPDKGSFERYIAVPCGHCPQCRKQRSFEWFLRLKEEAKNSSSTYFITLTYDDEHLYFNKNCFASVSLEHYQNFLKRLRFNHKKYNNQKIRFYGISEYGPTTYRPHYHFILFNLDSEAVSKGIIEDSWKQGFVEVAQVSDARLHYVANYHVSKYFTPAGRDSTFTTSSRRPGIGYSFVERAKREQNGYYRNQRVYILNNNVKVAMPRYFREKLYPNFDNREIKNYAKIKANFENRYYDSKDFENSERLKRADKIAKSQSLARYYKTKKKVL